MINNTNSFIEDADASTFIEKCINCDQRIHEEWPLDPFSIYKTSLLVAKLKSL